MINGRLLAIGRGEPIQTEIHSALASEEPVINIQHFSLWYGQKQALFDITLPVSRGKITAMIGPSGCGKSTLLRSVNRLNDLIDNLRISGDMRLNGDSIYGTSYGPVQGIASIRTTAKDNKIFVHVLEWPAAALEVRGIKPRVLSARLLADGQSLKFTQTEGNLRLDLPSQMPDANVTTIALMTS